MSEPEKVTVESYLENKMVWMDVERNMALRRITQLRTQLEGYRAALEKIAGRPGKRLIAFPETDFVKLYEAVAEKALETKGVE